MDENYSSKDAYWYRRNAVEAFFKFMQDSIPNVGPRLAELIELNHKITERTENIKFKCVYMFRAGQFVDPNDSGSGGDYSDSWFRSSPFNLVRVGKNGEEDYEDQPPRPGKPITVFLKPYDEIQKYTNEFTECWHSKCQEYNKREYVWPNRPPVTFLLCKGHADQPLLKTLHDLCINGTPIEDTEIMAMMQSVKDTICKRIDKSLDLAIERAIKILDEEIVPADVIDVRWNFYSENGRKCKEMISYIDLVSCKKIIIQKKEGIVKEEDDDEYVKYTGQP